MRKITKIVLILAVILFGSVIASFKYWSRPQHIDFTVYFPSELSHCGKSIFPKDREYIDLLNWFKVNRDGWINAIASYVPSNFYISPEFKVNILGNAVIVNYQNKEGQWNQVENKKNDNELNDGCSKENVEFKKLRK